MSQDGNKAASKESLYSGAIAGFVSVLALEPLDVLKTRLQEPSSHPMMTRIWNVYQTNGLRGYWRGTVPTLIRNVPGVALYFVTLNQLRYLTWVGYRRSIPFLDRFYDETRNKLTGAGNLIVGAASRTIAGTILMPATVLKVRFESSRYQYRGIMSALKSILVQEGWRGFFRGTLMTAFRDAPHAGLYLFFYESLKMKLPEGMQNKLEAGLIAGGAATLCTQPFDMLKTRIQLATEAKDRSIGMILRNLIKTDGINGLFKGVGPRMLRKGLSSAITWTVFEELMVSFISSCR